MKVTRQNINESYSITSEWVGDFARSLEKNADFLSNVRGVFEKRNAPKTIEEKMADIKKRVGYGLVKSNDDSLTNIKEAQNQVCECCSESCSVCVDKKTAKSSHTNDERVELVRLMTQMLEYINDFIIDRPELSCGAIIDHCRRHPQ